MSIAEIDKIYNKISRYYIIVLLIKYLIIDDLLTLLLMTYFRLLL
jgi:hypothetical protein